MISYKYLVLLGDGMSDRPLAELGGRTPLEKAPTPHLDRLASEGLLGRAVTIPGGMPKGSDVANLSVLGYDPVSCYTGRSPLEAAGMGVDLGDADVAFRCNLVTLGWKEPGGGISTLLPRGAPDPDSPSGTVDPAWVMVDFAGGHPGPEEASGLLGALRENLAGKGIEFHPGVSYRHLVVWRGGEDQLEVAPPHDLTDRPIGEGWPRGKAAEKVLALMASSLPLLADHPVNRARRERGKKPVNAIWLWGQGKRPRLPSFAERYGLSGAIITAVDLLRGIGACLGLTVVRVPGATGYLDTNYEGKASAGVEALKKVDFVFLHVEAPDEASHGGKVTDKLRAIADFDARVVGPVMKALAGRFPLRVLAMPDHATPLVLKTHSEDPVPFLAWDSEAKGKGSGAAYTERNAESTGLFIGRGHELMGRFIHWDWPPGGGI